MGNKYRLMGERKSMSRLMKWLIVIIIILFIVILVILGKALFNKKKIEVVLENPINELISRSNSVEEIDTIRIIEQGILEFDSDYIDYILVALGTGYLHRSVLTFQSPVIEFNLDGEMWESKIIKGVPNTELGATDKEDLRIEISRREAVRALMSEDIDQFLKDSFNEGRVEFEMVAGNTELFAKGYLSMYNALAGEEE